MRQQESQLSTSINTTTPQERLDNLKAYSDLCIELYKICKENPHLLDEEIDLFLEGREESENSQEYEDYLNSFEVFFEDPDIYPDISDNPLAVRQVACAM